MGNKRVSAKERREEEERLIRELEEKKKENEFNETENELENVQSSALFENIENQKKKEGKTFRQIKRYYKDAPATKQGSFYLDGEMMKLFRIKTFNEDTNIAAVIRELLIDNYFTEEELRKLYMDDPRA